MVRNNTKGFTLIELLIVIAIIGILVALALPRYQNYANKAKFQEVIMATSPYKIAADLAVQLEGLETTENLNAGTYGIPAAIATGTSPSKYLDNITIEGGIIKAVAKNITINSTEELNYILNSEIVDGQIKWSVSTGSTCIAANLCRAD